MVSKGHHPPNGIISTYFNYFQVSEIDYSTFAIYIYTSMKGTWGEQLGLLMSTTMVVTSTNWHVTPTPTTV